MRKLNTRDVFAVFRMIKKANVKNDIMELIGQDEKNEESVGKAVVLMIIEGLANKEVELEIYDLLSCVSGIENVEELELESLITLIKDIGTANDMKRFFTSVASLMKS